MEKYKPYIEKGKNVLLAALIFGAVGAYAGYSFRDSISSKLTTNVHVQLPASPSPK